MVRSLRVRLHDVPRGISILLDRDEVASLKLDLAAGLGALRASKSHVFADDALWAGQVDVCELVHTSCAVGVGHEAGPHDTQNFLALTCGLVIIDDAHDVKLERIETRPACSSSRLGQFSFQVSVTLPEHREPEDTVWLTSVDFIVADGNGAIDFDLALGLQVALACSASLAKVAEGDCDKEYCGVESHLSTENFVC